jgi:N-acetylmuramoyl-L-alanine amidase
MGSLFVTALLTSGIALGAPKYTVVLDPGHGGADHGAIHQVGSKRFSEKDITLALATEAAKFLRAQSIQTILTRKTDREVPLPERTALANRLKANVFVSIHMNSSSPMEQGRAEGFETYILNTATDQTSKRLADLENSVLPSSTFAQSGGGGDVALILKDLQLDANLGESRKLACAVQSRLVEMTGQKQKDRGVRQALFYVLLGADMPSALIEAGFLNHAKDRELVTTPVGQARVGRAIGLAISEFLKRKNQPHFQAQLSRCKVL